MNKIISLADNSAVYDVAKVTPLSIAVQISERFGNQIYLKREDEQSIHSFKLRGAYQKMSSLSDAQKIKGVVASSAGNHAQGVALAAKKLKIRAVIVMPSSTPKIKVQAVQQLGAEVLSSAPLFPVFSFPFSFPVLSVSSYCLSSRLYLLRSLRLQPLRLCLWLPLPLLQVVRCCL